jgi:23S rRNA (uracil1939-C5)-methyltransferase
LQAEGTQEIVERVKEYMEEYHIAPYDEQTHSGIVRHILTRVGANTGQVMVCLIINAEELPYGEELAERLSDIEGMTSISYNSNREKTNRILGDRTVTIWGSDTIEDTIGEVRYQISPQSFYQVNPVQTRVLYETTLRFAGLTGEETVWDLYCGIGTISLFLAQRAKHVYGVEIVPEAIADAERNARLNGFDNTTFYVGKAEEVLPREYANHHVCADVIVVDPPRKGCDQKALETMVKMQPQRIVYVSCDPATLARDVKWLGEHGYALARVVPVDMFPMGGHVETVCLLSRNPQ